MKIINTVYGDATGGRWQAMLNMYDTLTSYGHDVVLLRGKENAHLNTGDRPIHVIENTGFYSILGALRVRKFIEQQQPDVIIAHSGKAVWLFKNAMLGMAKKIPVIAVNHSHNVKRTLRADAFIHITPHVEQLVKALEKNTSSPKIHQVISNLTYLPSVEVEIRPLVKPVCIGMLTRMVDNKGIDILIHALSILKEKNYEFKTLLAGDGEKINDFKQLVQKLGLNHEVEFIGWVKGESKEQFMQQIDILAFPSFVEVQPLGIIEAFAWGKTVIASQNIGVCQCAHHGVNAWCTPTGDAQQLAEGLIYLIENPDKALEFAQVGLKESIEKYSFEKVAEQHDAFVRHVVSMGQQC